MTGDDMTVPIRNDIRKNICRQNVWRCEICVGEITCLWNYCWWDVCKLNENRQNANWWNEFRQNDMLPSFQYLSIFSFFSNALCKTL
jgi:hypothetical protein